MDSVLIAYLGYIRSINLKKTESYPQLTIRKEQVHIKIGPVNKIIIEI
jgi:hypothetical protein